MTNKMPHTPFSMSLSGSAKETELRIKNIVSGPKKRPPVLFLALMFSVCIFCGNLVSCQMAEAENVIPDVSQEKGSAQTDSTNMEPAPTARAAYAQVLEDLLYRSTTPDGEEWPEYGEEYTVGFEDMSENEFALADVDGDGREELVLLTRPNIYAGYRGYILDYDTDSNSVRIQFEGFPSFTFYESGAMAKDDSHAQGSWTSEFWPHTLYRYLPETDSYEAVGHLDAWEKEISDINEGNLPPFPTEKDTSGAGILYYINGASKGTYEQRIEQAVDQSVYLEWLEPYTGGGQPMELEYLPLTEENIDRLK